MRPGPGDEPTSIPRAFRRDPLANLEWVHADTLHSNSWNPNRVFRMELDLLERSLLSLGWVQPLLASTGGELIDGFHRWRLSLDSPQLVGRYKGMVPVARLDVDEPTAMAITVRINRAKGTHAAVAMSELAHAIVFDHGWTPARLAEEIGATIDEVTLLLQDSVFSLKKVQHWAYGQAWYPTPSGNPDANEQPEFGGYGNSGITDLKEAERQGVVPT